jgi:hypothetical protein
VIRAGDLSPGDRADLRPGARRFCGASHRLARRVKALVPLDDGWSGEQVAAALLVDDATVRRRHALFLEDVLKAHCALKAPAESSARRQGRGLTIRPHSIRGLNPKDFRPLP